MSNKDIATETSLSERLVDDLKNRIGSIMTDDDVKEIVGRGIETIFFSKPASKNIGTVYSPKWTEEKTVAEKIISQVVKDKVETNIKHITIDFLSKNPHLIKNELDSLTNEKMGALFVSSVASLFESQMDNFKFNLSAELANKGINL